MSEFAKRTQKIFAEESQYFGEEKVTLMDWGKVLHEYMAVFGTIAGATASFIGQYVYKNYFGSIKLYFYDIRIEMLKFDNERNRVRAENIDEAVDGYFYFNIDIFNGKEIPVCLRKIHIELFDEVRVEKLICSYYKDNRILQDLTYLNLPPKQLLSFSLSAHLNTSVIKRRNTVVKFVAVDQNDDIFERVIVKNN
jgi:hypothetical protein